MKRALRPVEPAPASVSIGIDPTQYWRLRAHMRDHQALVAHCQRQMAESQRILDGDMIACGLDPALRYTLTDEDCSAVHVDS